MKYKIGIFGSAADVLDIVIMKAKELGEELGKYDKEMVIINGATTGIPGLVSAEAQKRGVNVWGYSPATNLQTHQKITPGDDGSVYQKIVFIPNDYVFQDNIAVCRKYRNVTSTAVCDAGIIISGRWGTMNEFTNLYDMGKIIGVLTGTGGIADELAGLTKKISKKSSAKIFYSRSPQVLISNILREIKIRKDKR